MQDQNKIQQYFQSRKIDSVLFDMDSTLIDTNRYYKEETERVIRVALEKVYKNTSQKEMYQMILKVREIMIQKYINREKKPSLIYEETKEALRIFLEDNNIDEEAINNAVESIPKHFKDFYLSSPPLYPKTLEVLHSIQENNIRKGVYSHAQRAWTEIKIERIRKLYYQKYNTLLSLPFFTTDIQDDKNSYGWKMAARFLNFKLENTLVIGDNLESDIIPAINAGCKNLVHISKNVENLEKIIPEGVSVNSIPNIGELFSLF